MNTEGLGFLGLSLKTNSLEREAWNWKV